MKIADYFSLPTEKRHPQSRRLDQMSSLAVLTLMNKEDVKCVTSVKKQIKKINQGVILLMGALQNGGRMFFMGAGTSGRMGVIEAAEIPPTFNTPPSLVQAVIAGGKNSVFRSKEGAEDQGKEARRFVNKKVNKKDVLVGIAASGITPFVREGLKAAKKKNIKTILVTCHPGVSQSLANVVIAVDTGPEVISGSTRLKAGTATKLVLNALTVGTMVRLGKVYGNRMVDLQPRSRKLQARAARLISEIGGVSLEDAARYLRQSKGNTKVAIVMARKKLSRPQAEQKLKAAKGHLHKVIGRVS